jgi:myo-inositol-1(or 4)-monophosphatase
MATPPHHDVDRLLALAVDLAAAGVEIHRRGLSGRQNFDRKTSDTDLVSEVDREAERVIVEGIRRARPDDAVLAEEATDDAGSTGVRWLVDPLDGTVNYSRRYPMFAVSIGIEVDGVPTVGVVHDSMRDHRFVGIRGRGATRDGEPIRPSSCADVAHAVVATGFSYQRERRASQARALPALLPRIANIRCDGSAALDLCLVACGEVDAYVESDVAPWDVAAGRVIAEEAGATVRVTDIEGGTGVVAAPSGLFDPLLSLLVESGAFPATP